MTKDDITRLARESGAYRTAVDGVEYLSLPEHAFEAFASLVAAAEREACALVCERRHMGDLNREDLEARRCAEAIRARGEA